MRPIKLIPIVCVVIASACSSNDDTIQLVSQAGSDTATIVVDGRRSIISCDVNDEIVHGNPASIDNLLRRRACRSEVAVFARGNAMQLKEEVAWTDQPRDAYAIQMASRISVPLEIFVMTGNFATRKDDAIRDVDRASQLYDDDQCGVVFTANVTDLTTYTNYAFNLPEASCQDRLPEFKALRPLAADTSVVRVFYTQGDGLLAETCRDGNSAVILVRSESAGSEALAHELGHALSLGHTNDIAGIPLQDLMMSPAAQPGTLTIGQCFRANVNTVSVANASRYRTGPTRTCSDITANEMCPDLTLHK